MDKITAKNISKDAALELIRPGRYASGSFCLAEELGVSVMCKEYGHINDESEEDENNWNEIISDDYASIRDDEDYKSFQIW